MTAAPHFPNWTTAPPGQWRYKVPETGQTFGPYPDPYSLIDALKAHYQAAGYQCPSNIADLIEAYICDQPESAGYCKGGRGGSPLLEFMRQAKHTFHNALACINTLRTHARIGQPVTQSEAESRAKVCVACPLKVEVSGCMGCNLKTIQNAIRSIVGARVTTLDAQLKYCGLCDCHQTALIWTNREAKWVNLNDQQKAEVRIKAPECWIIKEGE